MKNKTEAKHTPTPWKIGELKTSIEGNCDLGRIRILDAEFVVRAANSHDALLDAAKEALCWLDPDCKWDGVQTTEDSSEEEKIIVELYAAIAQAEGKVQS
jgi:hypothetical protein